MSEENFSLAETASYQQESGIGVHQQSVVVPLLPLPPLAANNVTAIAVALASAIAIAPATAGVTAAVVVATAAATATIVVTDVQ